MADISEPGGHLYPFTPSDSADIPGGTSSAIYIAVAGALHVTTASGQNVVTPSLIAGWHPIRVTRVWATGTTATGLMSLRQ
jgi:hypothetical protein